MRFLLGVAACACVAGLTVGLPPGAVAAKAPRVETLYTVATGTQYLNNGDDRVRGVLNNPFDTQTQRLQPTLDTTGALGKSGPYAGDVVVYSFDLFASPKLGKRAGQAAYLCYFNYDGRALCLTYYELAHNKGTLVASGPVDFGKRNYNLVITGGTLKYAGVGGEVVSVGSTINSQRVRLVLLDRLASPSAHPERLTVHSQAKTAQFIDHADDRLRGMGTNPFNVKAQNLVIVTGGSEKEKGPFPGDDVLYTYRLYTGKKTGQDVGSALFTCYYTVAKTATCHSYFTLGSDLILASGSVPFDSKRFTLSVTGGTGKYRGARGQVRALPAETSDRLDFRFSIAT